MKNNNNKTGFDFDKFDELRKNKYVKVIAYTGCAVLAVFLAGKLMRLVAGVVADFQELKSVIKK